MPKVLKQLNRAIDKLKKKINIVYEKKLAKWEWKGLNANQKSIKPY